MIRDQKWSAQPPAASLSCSDCSVCGVPLQPGEEDERVKNISHSLTQHSCCDRAEYLTPPFQHAAAFGPGTEAAAAALPPCLAEKLLSLFDDDEARRVLSSQMTAQFCRAPMPEELRRCFLPTTLKTQSCFSTKHNKQPPGAPAMDFKSFKQS